MDLNQLFLNILRAALRGERYTPPQDVTADQWYALLHMAAIHKVDSLFWEAIYASSALQNAAPELADTLKQQVKQQVILQTLRTSEFLALNARLRAAGVTPLVVKGIVCRDLYPKADHRPSSDEDVLVPPEQFSRCRELLEQAGLRSPMPEEEAADSYEVPYRKPGSPLYIELHKQLFSDASDAYSDLNRFFADVFDRAVEVTACGGTVRTMEPTDHLFYLLCHAFKHFLHSGFGIRQICDILLFAEHHGGQLDWTRILENCRAIRADRFSAAIFDIGSRHLGFNADAARYPKGWHADGSALLQDVLGSGVYGTADSSRTHSSSITLDAVAARKEGRRSKGALLASLFPPAKVLEGRYLYLKKHPYLLPAAWTSRLLGYARRTAARDTNAAEALKVGSERVALLRQYGIIE